MAWCHACQEKKSNVSGNMLFKQKTYKKFVENQRKKKNTNFSLSYTYNMIIQRIQIRLLIRYQIVDFSIQLISEFR